MCCMLITRLNDGYSFVCDNSALLITRTFSMIDNNNNEIFYSYFTAVHQTVKSIFRHRTYAIGNVINSGGSSRRINIWFRHGNSDNLEILDRTLITNIIPYYDKMLRADKLYQGLWDCRLVLPYSNGRNLIFNQYSVTCKYCN